MSDADGTPWSLEVVSPARHTIHNRMMAGPHCATRDDDIDLLNLLPQNARFRAFAHFVLVVSMMLLVLVLEKEDSRLSLIFVVFSHHYPPSPSVHVFRHHPLI